MCLILIWTIFMCKQKLDALSQNDSFAYESLNRSSWIDSCFLLVIEDFVLNACQEN